eukprot:173805_1
MHQRYHTFDVTSQNHQNLHFISELENSSLQKQIQKYQSKNKSLKKKLSALETENNELEIENKIKDRLLDEKSKHIINITSENLRLKHELQTLKTQLHIKHKSILLNKKRRKKLSNRTCNKLNKTEISYEHADSDISSICSNENIQLPYLIPTMCKSVSEISECSNLSEQACRLSLPKTPQDAFASKSYTPIILAENKCNNDYNNVFIKISDNNMNIENDEWNDCEVIISPKNKKNNINFLHVDDSSSSLSSYDTTDSFENVSYMSDNTVLLMDMNFSKNNLQNSDY